MLIRFNIKNFLSFNKSKDGSSIEFSMIAGRTIRKSEHLYNDSNLKLLKLATIYGANASGKSNFVKALNFFRETVIKSLPKGNTEMYCKIDGDNNKDIPSYFEVEVKVNDKYYAYGFEVILSSSEFVSEWLVELDPKGDDKVLFSRDIINGTYEFGFGELDELISDRLNVYASDIKDDSSILFLKVMNQNKKTFYDGNVSSSVISLSEIYKWIKNDLDINFPDRPISNYIYLDRAENVKEICDIISAFGTGIKDYKMVEVNLDKLMDNFSEPLKNRIRSDIEKCRAIIRQTNHKSDGPKNSVLIMRSNDDFFIIDITADYEKCRTIQFEHEKNDVFFNLNEESDGTIRILDLIEVLVSNEGKTFIIDELDRCLHPMLSYKFIEFFLKVAEEKNIQLIVTTHESRLLDFDLLRRDEVWFIDKNELGESQMYSLEIYNDRFDKKIDKAYLDGRYGGVPIFTTLFPVD